MPRRNVIKEFVPESFYHIYNRGVYHQPLFKTDRDYATFLNIIKRHLSKKVVYDSVRRPFPHLRQDIELLAYCLMPNHVHLLVHNNSDDGITKLMRSVMTAYSMYFNRVHRRTGVLFESSYKAVLIRDEAYLWHISRYIHLNPQDLNKDYLKYSYSSYCYYVGHKQAEWINPRPILDMHNEVLSNYPEFVKDYELTRAELQKLRSNLADL